LSGASFYSKGGEVSQVAFAVRNYSQYVVFDWDSDPHGEFSKPATVAAIRIDKPKIPETWLSRTSGIRIERVGNWIFGFELNRTLSGVAREALADDVLKLLDYAQDFPQNR
jgi:hypothetical protein